MSELRYFAFGAVLLVTAILNMNWWEFTAIERDTYEYLNFGLPAVISMPFVSQIISKFSLRKRVLISIFIGLSVGLFYYLIHERLFSSISWATTDWDTLYFLAHFLIGVSAIGLAFLVKRRFNAVNPDSIGSQSNPPKPKH
jgi:membrane-associated HD superfamily phosphohydrolase